MWHVGGLCAMRGGGPIGVLAAYVNFVSVYRPPDLLWGDFNAVLSITKHRNCVGDRRSIVVFWVFLEELGFLDLPASGCKFTWYGGGSKAGRLDCFLISTSWIENFVDLVQHNLPHNISDHVSVLLLSGVVDWGPRPFRFLNCWLEKPSHVKLMGEEWNRISSTASPEGSIYG
ncbi:hypothetical protein V6N13_001735 [Hibiscus sabdariffa]